MNDREFITSLKQDRSDAYKKLLVFIQRSIECEIGGDDEFSDRWRWIAEEQIRYIKILTEDIASFEQAL